MGRINVTYPDDNDLAGWFNSEKATCYEEATVWDGSNNISVATGSQWHHEWLYRTAGGRWVLHIWSNYQNVPERYHFIDDEQARQWLLKNEYDKVVEEHFGPLEDERGPGRPEVGPAVHVRLTEEILEQVDQLARENGVSRAQMVRGLLEKAVQGA